MIHSIILVLLFILLFIYVLILSCLVNGLSRCYSHNHQDHPFVSVIVAARNEEKTIGFCLEALLNQTYDKDKYELIIVDDRSQDNTATIVKQYQDKNPNIKLVRIENLSPTMSPKKWALHSGIEESRGKIIFTTDADCKPRPEWIATTLTYFEDDVGLVAGFAPLVDSKSDSIIKRLIRLDGLALSGIAAGSFGMGFPITCTGQNLAYRRVVYNEVGGFFSIAKFVSGDDDLFLHLIRTKTDWKLRYALHPHTQVPADPPQSVKEFFYQRIRHASKGLYYTFNVKIGLMCIYFFYFLLFVSVFNQPLWLGWLIAFCIKVGFDFMLVKRMAKIFKHQNLLRYCLPAEFLHIPYVVVFGFLGQFVKFSWKDDVYSSKINKLGS